MSDQLKDPNLPDHAIVEVRDDGSALRNDGLELQAANSNPWYVLATVFGEPAEGESSMAYDPELAAKNRRAWNGWACAGLSVDERADRAEETVQDVRYLQPLTEVELAKITRRFKDRMVGDAELPDRTQRIDFSHTYFSKSVCFDRFVFEQDITFRHAVFNLSTNFSLATFSSGVGFASTSFCASATFHKTKFNAVFSFASAIFNATVNFASASFNAYAIFHDSTFNAVAIFNSATFRSIADFRSTTFNSFVDFNSVTFNSSADFDSGKYKSKTEFKNAKFISAVPQFYGAKLYEDTVFTLPDNYRDNWPPISGQVRVEGQDEPIKVMPATEQKRAYNRLRLFMNRSLQFDEEQFFHRQEMRCKKEVASQPVQRGLFGLYEAVSDYGNSVSRPAEWLAVIWVWGALAKLKAVGGGSFWPDYHSIPSAMGWSLSNLFPFLGFWRLYSVENLHLNTFLLLIGGAQTICGFALLFLLGLGLRNMFRLR